MDASTIVFVIVALAAVALIARRGGRDPEPTPWPTATVISASDSAGGWYDVEAEVLRHYAPDPVQMINQAGPVQCVNASINGLRLVELLRGGPVAQGVGRDGRMGLNVRPLREQLVQMATPIVVIGAWLNDAINTDLSVEEFRALVRECIDTCLAADKHLAFRGQQGFLETPRVSAHALWRVAQFGAVLREEAAARGITVLDPLLAGPPEICSDGLHGTEAYMRRIADTLAVQLQAEALRYQGSHA